jgi:hypothetical protein
MVRKERKRNRHRGRKRQRQRQRQRKRKRLRQRADAHRRTNILTHTHTHTHSHTRTHTQDINAMFDLLRETDDVIQVPDMIDILEQNGFLSDDPRWKPSYEALLRVSRLDKATFSRIFSAKISLLSKVKNISVIYCWVCGFNLESFSLLDLLIPRYSFPLPTTEPCFYRCLTFHTI